MRIGSVVSWTKNSTIVFIEKAREFKFPVSGILKTRYYYKQIVENRPCDRGFIYNLFSIYRLQGSDGIIRGHDGRKSDLLNYVEQMSYHP